MPGQTRTNLWWPLLLVAGLLLGSATVYQGAVNLEGIREDLAQVKAMNQRLDRENRALYRKVQQLRSNPRAVEQAARLKMGLVRSDEVIYRLPTPTGKEQGK